MNVWSMIIELAVGVIIMAPVLWVSERLLVGREKAKFTDAIWIIVLGIVIGVLVNYFSAANSRSTNAHNMASSG